MNVDNGNEHDVQHDDENVEYTEYVEHDDDERRG